ncbi:MAG: S8 family serine peptidase, partial [candidate division Zixibacteria bacterium]|nr:S8 family serine peptidase [candidate division Zixibacteria bacterium]
MAGQDKQVATSLIVKLKTGIAPVISIDKKGAVSTGITSLDALNTKNEISGLKYLFPSDRFSHLPGNLKNILILEFSGGENINSLAEEYNGLEEVAYAHPDWQAELYDTPDDPLYIYQWALNNTGQSYYVRSDSITHGLPDADIDAQEVFVNPPDNTRTVIVAMIDTGVDLEHPDLAAHLWTNANEIANNDIDDDHNGYIDDKFGWDFTGDSILPYWPDNDPTDPYGHGTHCSGIITAITDNATGIAGLLSNCKIMPIKFYPNMVSSFAAQAIIYAADNGADVISMSWGYPWPVDILYDALAYARSKGVVLVASAGNDGVEKENYPASFPGVITVGATNAMGLITEFSTHSSKLDISAPGRYILSLRAKYTDMYDDDKHTIGEYYYIASGTSMSGPHVAGAAAYLQAISPGLTPDATENILEMSADDIIDPFNDGSNYPGWDKYSGYGCLNLNQALNNAPGLRALISYPKTNQFISGNINITGLADGDDFTQYTLEYGQGSVPVFWTEIITSSTPVTDRALASWNTAGLNGQYTLRLRVGETNISLVTFHLTNNDIAEFDSPQLNDTVISWTNIYGSATCPDFNRYLIDFGAGSKPTTWSVITESSVPVNNDELAYWDVNNVSDGLYTLRLQVFSNSRLEDSTSVRVYVQSIFLTENAWRYNFDTTIAIVPNYGDFDYDGNNEIVVGTKKNIYFFNPDGTLKTTGMPVLPNNVNFMIPPAVGDLDGDGRDDLVLCSNTKIYAFLSSQPDFEITHSGIATYDYSSTTATRWPVLYLKDIDGDLKDEIFYFRGTGDIPIYNSDGSLRTMIPAHGTCGPVPADLNNDGLDELYIPDTAVAQYDDMGNFIQYYSYNMPNYQTYDLSVADIDNDDTLELISFGRNGTTGYYFHLFAYEHQDLEGDDYHLELVEGFPRNTGIEGYLLPGGPVFGDIDRDGNLEYFIAFYELAYGQIFGWRSDGTTILGDSTLPLFATSSDPSIMTNLLLADLNNDGISDILANAFKDVMWLYKAERIIAWDSKNGEVLEGWPKITKTEDLTSKSSIFNVPVLGDVNKDGFVDVMTTNTYNQLLFFNLEGIYYDSTNCPASFWRYSRRMNNNAVSIEHPDCCVGLTGNVNCSDDEEPDISDITRLIDFLYISHRPLCCYDEADCDGSGGPHDISDITYLIAHLYLDHRA